MGVILIDYRTGSKEFLEPIKQILHASDTAEICQELPADFSFDGNVSGGNVGFGIERKTIEEMVAKSGRDRLVDHQIPLMQDFGYGRMYLLVEGFWKPTPDGRIEKYGRPTQMMYSSVDNFLHSLSLTTGIRIMRSGSKAETARMVVDLYNLVQKPWEKHRAHQAVYEDTLHLKRPGLVQRCAKEFKGVGMVNSVAARRGFKTVHEMVSADIAGWEGVLGHRKIAEKVWKEIRGIK